MLLQDVTKILQVLLAAYQPISSQDALTQRRIGQISEVIGAVGDVAEDETASDKTIAEKRTREAHDIIHRVARILAMEESETKEAEAIEPDEDFDDGYAFEETDDDDDSEDLQEVQWDGKLAGETIELAEDEE